MITAEDHAWIELGWHFDPLEHRDASGKWAVNGAPAAVFGNPATARHVVVFVPGTGSSTPAGRQDNISRARGLKIAMDAAGRGSTATVTWGYNAPGTLGEALRKGNAQATAGRLRDYVNQVKAANPGSHVTVIGHSYGSTVAGMAAHHGMRPDDLVFVGSPGVTVRHASQLGVSREHIWAGDEHQDPIGRLATTLSPDFRGNPDHAGFGALRFGADAPGEVFPGWQHAAAHSAYFHPGSQALGNMVNIATGHYTGVTRASDEARLLANPVELGWRFNPAEARDAHGQWTRSGAGYTAPDPARLVNSRGRPADPGDHPFFKAHPVSAANILRSYAASTPSERAQGMRWYADAHTLAAAIGRGDVTKGAGVLAAYSPQTSWPVNMFNAAKAVELGRALGPGEGMITRTMQANAQEALDGKSTEENFGAGAPKIRAFAHLIEDGGDKPEDQLGHVVLDRHAMSVAVGQRLTKAEADKAPIGQERYYQHVADEYRKAALAISARGTPIAPHQVQAVTWLHQQAANEAQDMASTAAGIHGRAGAGRGRQAMIRNAWQKWDADAAAEKYPVTSGTTALTNDDVAWITELAGWEHEPRDSKGKWTYDTGIVGRITVTRPSGSKYTVSTSGMGLTHIRDPDDMPVSLYHGTNALLSPGDKVEPGHPGNFVRRMNNVYLTEQAEGDETYKGARGYGKHVYEVKPTGFYGHRRDARGIEWATESPVTVIREVPDPRTTIQMSDGTLSSQIIELRFNPAEPRDSRGRWTRFGQVGTAADVMMKNREGFSVSVRSGREPARGYMVAQTDHTHTYPASILDDHMALTRAIDDMLVKEKDAFKGGDTYLGGWVHDGKLWLEPSDNITDQHRAVAEGTRRNQIAIWDVDHGQEIDTGGSGGGRIYEHAQGAGENTAGLLGQARFRAAGDRLGTGGPDQGGIFTQLIELGHWQGWRTEPRDKHGRWTRLPGEADGMLTDQYQGIGKLLGILKDSAPGPAGAEVAKAADALSTGDGDGARQHLDAAVKLADPDTASYLRDISGRIADAQDRASARAGLNASTDPVHSAVTSFVTKAKDIVPGLVGGSHEEWNGRITLFRAEDDPGILAAMRWNGTMNVQDTLAQHIQYGLAHPDQPISDPAAFSVPLHELIHGTVPAGSAKANMQAYQDYPKAQIEEGFTELGTVHHAPEFFTQMGIGDRETAMTATDAEAAYRANGNRPVISWGPAKPEVTMSKALSDVHLLSLNYSFPFIRTVDQALRQGDVDTAISSLDNAVPGLPDNHPARRDVLGILSELRSMTSQPGVRHATMTEYARQLQDPARVSAGNAWGHYPDQAKSAQDWVQQIAAEEGFTDFTPGTDGWKRVVALADEVNQHGAASKIPVMARQMVRALVKDPKMAANPVFVNDLTASIEANIIKAWEGDTATAAKAAYAGSKQVARAKMMEQMRQAA